MDDNYGETETSGTATDTPAGVAVEASNAKAIARLEKKASSYAHTRSLACSLCSCADADAENVGGLAHGAHGLHGPIVQCGGWSGQWLTIARQLIAQRSGCWSSHA